MLTLFLHLSSLDSTMAVVEIRLVTLGLGNAPFA
jgi:hypothetical protein